MPYYTFSERPAAFSLAVGTQAIGVRYQFTDETALVESAREIFTLGSDTLKIALTPKYENDYLLKHDRQIHSVMDLLNIKKSYHEVMDMPFRNIMLWVYPFSDRKSAFHKGRIPGKEAKQIYEEIYALTAHLLSRYSGSGKSFFIGNWEGDWHLLKEVYDYNLDPDPETIKGAIEWFNLREKAVADARRDTHHEEVEVYFYIELNHVGKSMRQGRPSLVNRVLPFIRTDYVSWSSYDVTKEAGKIGGEKGKQMFFEALDYIESHLPESDIPGKRVFIGEYGFELDMAKDVDLQSKFTANIMKWGLEWGCPFLLYWELYCNETDAETGKHRGYWLIDDNGDKQPVWFLHRDFLGRANAWLDEYVKKHGRLPQQGEYHAAAAQWLQPMTTYEVNYHGVE